MAHTSGPWEWSAADNEYNAVVAPPVDAEHDVGPWFTAIVSCSDTDVQNANARLIAAAPDLLAVVRMVKAACGDAENWRGGTREFLLAADAALAKVEGRHE